MSAASDTAAAALVGGALATWLVLPSLSSSTRSTTAPSVGWIGFDVLEVARAASFRNAKGRLDYRPVGASGERYPSWVDSIRGKSGCYVIRDAASGEVLYVGASYTGRLYQTLTRHLQQWGRWKAWWRGQYGQQNTDPGTTYRRDRVEVAVRETPAKRALDEESALIRKLRPRDNLIGLEPVPF